MGPDLKQLAFDQGDVDDLNTEELMMARIKSLAVMVQHAAVHTVAPGENIIGYSVQIHYAIIQLIIRKISKLSSSFAKFETPWPIRKIGS